MSISVVSRHERMRGWLMLMDATHRTWMENGDVVHSHDLLDPTLDVEDLRRCMEFLSEGDYLDITAGDGDPQEKLNALTKFILETKIPATHIIRDDRAGEATTYQEAFMVLGELTVENMLPYTLMGVRGWRGLLGVDLPMLLYDEKNGTLNAST